MENDIQMQKPFTVSQISNEKPVAPRTKSMLSGFIANSMNGGHNKTIAFKQVMAGEKHYEYRLKANFQMLTPLTPVYQNLKMTIRTYFVPNSRVWKNAEKFTAQKGGASEIKITQMPNLAGKAMPIVGTDNGEGPDYTNLCNTTFWRDSFVSSYIPRLGMMGYDTIRGKYQSEQGIVLPAVSALGLRGRIAIYNDFERNKEFDEEILEYNSDTVSEEEWNSYCPTNASKMDYYTMRAKREDNYYTDFRTELQGFEQSYPPSNMSADEALMNWSSWESKIAESRSQAENSQLNNWQIIAKIRGSKMLSEGKVQLLSKRTFNLNYSAITQNTYNNNENVAEEFRVMGKQGAYSYTQIDLPLYAGMEFIEEGYIHVIATVSADNVFESGIDRNELNTKALDRYRPDMEGDKKDVLYKCESGNYTNISNLSYYSRVEGFKRKYSELFKLPNVIGGDLTTMNYYEPMVGTNIISIDNEEQVITNKTYQFFEISKEQHVDINGTYSNKLPWRDYTDLLINKNQAILNEVYNVQMDSATGGVRQQIIKGQNQVFFVGVCQCLADLPVNEEIKNNYTQWGEH